MRGADLSGRVGYRAAIHMKEYRKHRRSCDRGGDQDFLGNTWRAPVVALGLEKKGESRFKASHIGTGMHAADIPPRPGG